MKKKVLLVQMPSRAALLAQYPVYGFGPYSLACLASHVEDLAEIMIYDATGRTVQDVMEVVQVFSPDMVGLCVFLTAHVPATIELGHSLDRLGDYRNWLFHDHNGDEPDAFLRRAARPHALAIHPVEDQR